MSKQLSEFIEKNQLSTSLLSAIETEGFITAMAATPGANDPSTWFSLLWGGEDVAPFKNSETLEEYAAIIISLCNKHKESLMKNQWKWPEACALSEKEIINSDTRDFCEGLLSGLSLTRENWENLMPEDSKDGELLAGVLLCVGLLFDPEAGIEMLAMQNQNVEDIAQFDEIFRSLPMMLSGLTIRGAQLNESASSN